MYNKTNGLAAAFSIVVLNNRAKKAVISQLHEATNTMIAVSTIGYKTIFFKGFIVI